MKRLFVFTAIGFLLCQLSYAQSNVGAMTVDPGPSDESLPPFSQSSNGANAPPYAGGIPLELTGYNGFLPQENGYFNSPVAEESSNAFVARGTASPVVAQRVQLAFLGRTDVVMAYHYNIRPVSRVNLATFHRNSLHRASLRRSRISRKR